MRTIYETTGRAKEYAMLALNIYRGCPHGCLYCYVPPIIHVDKEQFRSPENIVARDGLLAQLGRDAVKFAGTDIRVMLCFTCDPYPACVDSSPTREAIEILRKNYVPFTVLTKGGLAAARDFDLYDRRTDAFAVTLTTANENERRIIEPGAAPVNDRIETLREAHDRGIFTWVSIEPAFDANRTLAVIEATSPYVDHYKIGWLNYHRVNEFGLKTNFTTYWEMGISIINALERLGKSFWIKTDLARKISSKVWNQMDIRKTAPLERRVTANVV